MAGKKETLEPLYKKWTTWVATLTPIILFFLGWYFVPPDKETSAKAKKYDALWAQYLATRSKYDGLKDSLSAVYITLYKKQAYIEMLENRVQRCEGELSATTKIYMQREASKRVDNMQQQEKNDMLQDALKELQTIE